MTGWAKLRGLGPVVLAGLSFLVFSPVELTAGHLTHNTAIAANASHDAFDGIFLLFFGWLDAKLASSADHRWFCHGRGIIAICVALMAVAFVGIGILFEHHNHADAAEMIAALIIGPVSFMLNRYWQKQLDPQEHHHGGFNTHLMGDMAGSAVVFICGPLVYLTGQPVINFWGGIATLLMVAVIAVQKAIEIGVAIGHSAESHTHESEHRLSSRH